VELEYSDRNSKRAKLYIAVGVIIALIVGALVFVALRFSNISEASQKVEQRQVVVAAQEIASRKTIAEGDVAMRTVNVDPTNSTAFTSLDQVLGRISGVPISAGQMLTPNLLASTTSGQAFSIIEAGKQFDPNGPALRAVSVTVPDEKAVGGTLQPGQRVDLIVTLTVNPVDGGTAKADAQKKPGDLVAGPSTKVTLQEMTILARQGTSYILRADLPTAEKIVELTAAGGQFAMVLRPEPDDREATTPGSTLDRLIEEFGFPPPKVAAVDAVTPTARPSASASASPAP
jgi:Flp pilus assembly protein CpaB